MIPAAAFFTAPLDGSTRKVHDGHYDDNAQDDAQRLQNVHRVHALASLLGMAQLVKLTR